MFKKLDQLKARLDKHRSLPPKASFWFIRPKTTS